MSALVGAGSWLVRQGSPLDAMTFTVSNQESVTFVNADGEEVTKTEITQEEIPAQVNRAIVVRGFTFIQFVPLVESTGRFYVGDGQWEWVTLRPEGGEIEFDKGPYYTNALSASFVIYNDSGEIFPIPQGVRIDEIDAIGGLIWQHHVSGKTFYLGY